MLRGPLRLGGTDVGGLEDGTEKALGGDRMIADELPVAEHHAAEILRPWLVRAYVEDHAADLASAQFLRFGRGGKKSIDFPCAEQRHGVAGTRDPMDVLLGVEPDLRRHERQIQVITRAEPPNADPLAFQVADGADGLMREHLVAAGMHARQRRDRLAGIQMRGDPCSVLKVEVDFAAPDGRRRRRHRADIGEPFRAQQFLGDVHGREADRTVTGQPDRSRFRRPLVGKGCPGTKDAGRTGRGQGGEKIAARLSDLHSMPPV